MPEPLADGESNYASALGRDPPEEDVEDPALMRITALRERAGGYR